MGLENREYLRDSYGGGGPHYGGQSATPTVKWLLIANIGVFVLQVFTQQSPQFNVTDWLKLDAVKMIEQFQVWRIVTSAFCHDPSNLIHILFNMLFLYWFGRVLEIQYGSREFLAFYLTAAIAASLAFLGIGFALKELHHMIGASGAVMGVTMLFAMHYPRQKILLFFVIPVEIRWVVLGYVFFDLYPVVQAFSGVKMTSGIAHAAHLGGLLFGFLYWKFQWRLSPLSGGMKMPRIRRPRVKPSIRIYEPSKEELDERVDALLAKIQEQGEASLTDKEREFLKKASQQYKNR